MKNKSLLIKTVALCIAMLSYTMMICGCESNAQQPQIENSWEPHDGVPVDTLAENFWLYRLADGNDTCLILQGNTAYIPDTAVAEYYRVHTLHDLPGRVTIPENGIPVVNRKQKMKLITFDQSADKLDIKKIGKIEFGLHYAGTFCEIAGEKALDIIVVTNGNYDGLNILSLNGEKISETSNHIRYVEDQDLYYIVRKQNEEIYAEYINFDGRGSGNLRMDSLLFFEKTDIEVPLRDEKGLGYREVDISKLKAGFYLVPILFSFDQLIEIK